MSKEDHSYSVGVAIDRNWTLLQDPVGVEAKTTKTMRTEATSELIQLVTFTSYNTMSIVYYAITTYLASTTADILKQIEGTNLDVCNYTLFHNKRQVTARELNHTIIYLSTVYILTEFNCINSHLYLPYSLPTAFPDDLVHQYEFLSYRHPKKTVLYEPRDYKNASCFNKKQDSMLIHHGCRSGGCYRP